MTFISFAQNREDVILWRALGHLEKGFYIDVGANDPVEHSVTKAFYDRGWRGLNVEPVQQWHDRLREARPRDINLQVAAGSHEGVMTLYEVADSGLSTSSKIVAERHGEKGFGHRVTQVQVDTLGHLCSLWGIEEVHFLKIDVEGAEREVLLGTDFTRVRPWIILVESTEPLSQRRNHEEWEDLITTQGYAFVHFDGLNRFYLADERIELGSHFDAPPNVFDDYLPVGHLSALEQVGELSHRCNQLARRGEELSLRGDELAAALAQAEQRSVDANTKIVALENEYLKAELEHQKSLLNQETFRHRLERAEAQLVESGSKIARLEQIEQVFSECFPTLVSPGGDLLGSVRQLSAELVRCRTNQLNEQARYQQLINSQSWRLTRPLREARYRLKGLRRRPGGLKLAAKKSLRPWLIRLMRQVLSRPAQRQRASALVRRFPGLYSRLAAMATRDNLLHDVQRASQPPHDPHHYIQGWEPDLSEMSVAAREHYQFLKSALENKPPKGCN
ncbi:FkbM family methyltransferase [Pseudomonas oryzihabitans]|uniref:FkbM family methyltransferase n=1 Tax=Pseudomonas oryzihabitans TaxID=47885 RepID=UPI00119CED25|nr:FkbM family methyltransferase [Pseudomonas oryzihabitans]